MTMKAVVVVVCMIAGLLEVSICQLYSPSQKDSQDGVGSRICLTKRVKCQTGETSPRFDGACNNRDNPTWGATLTMLPRLLPPAYADSKGEPRAYGKYGRLQSPRKISNIMTDGGKPHSSAVSHLHVIFGQMLAHDVVHTPMVKSKNGSKLDCDCGRPHRNCINIEIPVDDEQRLQTNKKCIKLARSEAAVGVAGCEFRHREQINSLSSVIDGTFLYGKSDQEANAVRDPYSLSGEIKLVKNPTGGPHGNLPSQKDLRRTDLAGTMDCPVEVHIPKGTPCFVAGDVRVNENVGLTSIQTLWARYHNWVARGLKSVNPHWSSDKVFNVARRIISALLQSMVYGEFLPPLIGPVLMERFGLTLSDYGYWNGYDPRYNPAITNAFTTAALRYGHSQITSKMKRPGPFFKSVGIPDVLQENTFFNSVPFQEKRGGGSGSILRGFMVERAEKMDENVLDALRNYLYREIGERFGDDLFAINLQRGRDHGLPPYNKYREMCGLSRAKSFEDLSDTTRPVAINKLKNAYDHVDDIDLFIGGLSENSVTGGEIGPTFSCIIAQALRAVKRGDRYWHENEHSPSPFTPKQLQAIRGTTFARILCDAGDDMKLVVKFPLKTNNGKPGTIVSCSKVVKLDLTVWRDSYQSHEYTPHRYRSEGSWTAWFVTWEVDERQVDVYNVKRHLKVIRADDICDEISDSETRNVPGDRYVQIRFRCEVGTIRSTDVPYQISQNHYFTAWLAKQDVVKYDFPCENVVAIQAMVQDGSKFALETGDVFQRYGSDGFSCQDYHQRNGRCQRYKVRALCLGKLKDDSYGVYQPALTPRSKQQSRYEFPRLPDYVRETADWYCRYYGLCCGKYSKPYTTYVPSDATRNSQYMCTEYDICCTA